MNELTKAQIERQDDVDGQIFALINALLPPNKEVEWDIELIGNIRDAISRKSISEQEFYPFLEDEGKHDDV